MPHWLRGHLALAEDPGSISSTQVSQLTTVTPAPEYLMLLVASGTCSHAHKPSAPDK